MSIDYTALKSQPRLLLEATLKPLQGERFQATGFADLGAALYTLPDGTKKLLVESAQSVANRLEMAIWDESNDDWIDDLNGLPYVRIDCGHLGVTNTVNEFHRLNSPYLWKGDDNERAASFRKDFCARIGIPVPKSKSKKGKADNGDSASSAKGILNRKKLTDAIFWYDPCSLIHGVFLEKLDGRLRVTRALSGFVEATNVNCAESGGVKVDKVLPSPKTMGLKADDGFGNVPFHRSEFVAEKIVAFFNLDLDLIRSYGLPETAERLLVVLSLLKIRRFLNRGLRLRAACDLEAGGITTTKPEKDFSVPTEEVCQVESKALIKKCLEEGLFSPKVVISEFKFKAKDIKIDIKTISAQPDISDARKKDKLTSLNKSILTIKSSLVEEIGYEYLADVLGEELFKGNQEAKTIFADLLEAQLNSDDEKTEENSAAD
jgi:CRISPR-associated protein Csb1